MVAGRVRKTCKTGPVEMNAIHIAAEDAAFGAGEVDPIAVVIDSVQRAHFPRTVRDLFLERSVGGVLIEMFESAAFAQPEERSVLEERHLLVVVGLDPCFCRLSEHRL